MRQSAPLLLALVAIVILLALMMQCNSAVVEWSPEHQASADATATAIAPCIEVTRQYMERVLPTVQAAEAAQAEADIVAKQAARRAWSGMWQSVWATGRIVAMAALVVSFGTFLVAVGCYVWERAKQARVYEPVQLYSRDKVLYLPERHRLADPMTGRTWDVMTFYPADVEHGRILIDWKAAGKSARYSIGPSSGAHRPQILEAVRR